MKKADYQEWYLNLLETSPKAVERAITNLARAKVLEGTPYVLPGGDVDFYTNLCSRYLDDETMNMLTTDYRKL